MTLPAPDLALLRFLARRTSATASQLCAGLGAAPGEVRGRLAALESHRLVGSRQEAGATPPRRVFFVTAEGRRAAGVDKQRWSSRVLKSITSWLADRSPDFLSATA